MYRALTPPSAEMQSLINLMWPNGPVCPHCDSSRVTLLSTREKFKCRQCRRQFSPTTGTPLAYRKLSPQKVVEIISVLKFVRSAQELSDICKIQYRSAWYLMRRISNALAMEARQGQDPQGLDRNDDSAGRKATQSTSTGNGGSAQ